MEYKDIELIVIEDKIRSRYLRKDVKFIYNGILKENINVIVFPSLSIAKENIPDLEENYILSWLPLLNDEHLLP